MGLWNGGQAEGVPRTEEERREYVARAAIYAVDRREEWITQWTYDIDIMLRGEEVSACR